MITNSITQQPGTQKNPTQTALTKAAFVRTNRVHFPNGVLESIPEWLDATPANAINVMATDYLAFIGACRSVFGTTLNGSYIGDYFMYGTDIRLYTVKNASLFNMTPFQLTSDTLGADPLAMTNTSKVVTVTQVAHGLVTGDRITMDGVGAAVRGVPQVQLEADHIITRVDADTYTFRVSTAATSTGTGGGAAVEVFPPIASGISTQQTAQGFGAGLLGAGLFGADQAGDATDYRLPRIWSFGSFGNDIVMSPGDDAVGDGTKIYIWDGNTSLAPTILTNAPVDCHFVAVVNNSVVALCVDTIEISQTGNATVWTPAPSTDATIIPLQRIRRTVCALPYGDKSCLIFTQNEVLLLQYVGEPNYWDLRDLSASDGIASPNSACVIDGIAYWQGSRGWYRFAGSFVEKLDNPMNGEFYLDGINVGKAYHSFSMPDISNQQVYFFSPRDGDMECGDYIIYSVRNGSFTLGEMERTAAMRGSFIADQLYAANSASDTVAGAIYRHFTRNDDLEIGWVAETADSQSAAQRFRVREFVPDSYQGDDISVQYLTRENPQGVQSESAVYTVSATTPIMTVRAAGKVRALRLSGNKRFTFGAWKESIEMQGRR